MKPLSWYWFDLRCWWRRAKERALMAIVWRLPPALVYWAFIRVQANATSGPFGGEHPDAVGWSTACKRWEARQGGDRGFVLDKPA